MVSRRTWFRHKVARIMQDQMDEEACTVDDPLPVETVSDLQDDSQPLPDQMDPEVQILTKS
jgi:hypothetical protein